MLYSFQVYSRMNYLYICLFFFRLFPHIVVQLLIDVWLFGTPWTAAHQASLPSTLSWGLLKLMSIQLALPSHLLRLFRIQVITGYWTELLSTQDVLLILRFMCSSCVLVPHSQFIPHPFPFLNL